MATISRQIFLVVSKLSLVRSQVFYKALKVGTKSRRFQLDFYELAAKAVSAEITL
jgi:uncharacterized membrane protein